MTLRTMLTWVALAMVPWSTAGVIESGDNRLQESGLSGIRLGFRPQQIKLGPGEGRAGAVMVRRGVLEMGALESPVRYPVEMSWRDGHPDRLTVDGDGNGKMAEGEQTAFRLQTFWPVREEDDEVWEASVRVKLPLAGGSHWGSVRFYWSKRAAALQPDWLNYYCDYGMGGKVVFPGGQEVRMMLVDMACRGTFDFGDVSVADTAALWLDLDGNGMNSRGEYHLVNRSFEAFGRWYRVAEVAVSGRVRLTEVPAPHVEKRLGPDLSPGKDALPFAAVDTAGRAVRMPDGYRGRLVLLDFWASWCGPCITELPTMVEAARRFRGKGIEMIGISLDGEGKGGAVATQQIKESITWPQIHNGKGWQSEVAKLYGIDSIPFRVLVDGTSGRIVASGDLRGDELLAVLEKAVGGLKGSR